MSLSDGMIVESYEDLIKIETSALLYSPNAMHVFSYNNRFDSPCLIDIEYGTRFFGADIKTFVAFPLHHVRFAPFTQEEMDAS